MLRCVANDRHKQVGDISISADWHHIWPYIHLRIIIGNILATQRSMGENAFLMVFQERWSFLPLVANSCPRRYARKHSDSDHPHSISAQIHYYRYASGCNGSLQMAV